MGRSPCCDGVGVKKGPWMPEEDEKLVSYIQQKGHRSWKSLPKLAGLNRCGKSCRLRWNNYLRPDIKRGKFTDEEQNLIISLHSILGNKWSQIASHLNGRTDNEIKNYWNTHLKKRLLGMGIDPVTHRPRFDLQFLARLPHLLQAAGSFNNSNNNNIRLHGDHNHTAQLLNMKLISDLLKVVSTRPNPFLGASNFHMTESETLNVGFMQPNAAYMTQSNIVPNSVSVSPSSSSVHEIEVNANQADMAINSYSLTNTKALEELLMSDEVNEFRWEDLLAQTSPSFPSI